MKTCPKTPTLLEWSRMTPQNLLIFDKSDLVRSRTEGCKNHSHVLKLKNLEVIFIDDCWNLGYVFKSFRNTKPNGSSLVGWTDPHTKLTQKL
jgi:hypothetical protein